MPNAVTDYLLEQADTDWSAALAPWSWLLPAEVTLWLANRFADLFLVFDDGSIHQLDIGLGTFDKVAESRDEFCEQMNDDETAAERLLIPLVDELVECGVALQPGQCYGFKMLPVFGGEYAMDNVAPITVADYIAACGAMHEQIRHLPDGSRVAIAVVA